MKRIGRPANQKLRGPETSSLTRRGESSAAGHRLLNTRGSEFGERAESRCDSPGKRAPGSVPIVVPLPCSPPRTAPEMRCLLPPGLRAAFLAQGSPKRRRHDPLFLRNLHRAVPERQLVLQVLDPRPDPRRNLLICKGWFFGAACEQPAPGKKFSHPALMLLAHLGAIVRTEILPLPETDRGADLVPILDRGTDAPQHASLEVRKLTSLKRQWFLQRHGDERQTNTAAGAFKSQRLIARVLTVAARIHRKMKNQNRRASAFRRGRWKRFHFPACWK